MVPGRREIPLTNVSKSGMLLLPASWSATTSGSAEGSVVRAGQRCSVSDRDSAVSRVGVSVLPPGTVAASTLGRRLLVGDAAFLFAALVIRTGGAAVASGCDGCKGVDGRAAGMLGRHGNRAFVGNCGRSLAVAACRLSRLVSRRLRLRPHHGVSGSVRGRLRGNR
jgi:hypothetical protein